jgi:hypothetical protein
MSLPEKKKEKKKQKKTNKRNQTSLPNWLMNRNKGE